MAGKKRREEAVMPMPSRVYLVAFLALLLGAAVTAWYLLPRLLPEWVRDRVPLLEAQVQARSELHRRHGPGSSSWNYIEAQQHLPGAEAALRQHLASTDAERQLVAARGLARLPEPLTTPTLAALVEASASGHLPATRVSAFESLALASAQQPAAARAGCRDSHAGVRNAALHLLLRQPALAATDEALLLALAAEGYEDTAEMAIEGLSQIDSPTARAAVLTALRQPGVCRLGASASAALQHFTGETYEAALSILLEHLIADQQRWNGLEACVALREAAVVAGADQLPLHSRLSAKLDSPDWQQRQLAAHALFAAAPAAEARLVAVAIEALGDDKLPSGGGHYTPIRNHRSAFAWLAQRPAACPALLAALPTAADAQQRYSLAFLLGLHAYRDADAAIAPLLLQCLHDNRHAFDARIAAHLIHHRGLLERVLALPEIETIDAQAAALLKILRACRDDPSQVDELCHRGRFFDPREPPSEALRHFRFRRD